MRGWLKEVANLRVLRNSPSMSDAFGSELIVVSVVALVVVGVVLSA